MTIQEIIRKEKTMIDFSKKYDIPYRTVQSWDSGDRKPPAYVIKLFEKLYEMQEKIGE